MSMYVKDIEDNFFTVMHPYVVRNDFVEITKTTIIKQLKESLKFHKLNIALQDENQVTNDLIFVTNFLTHIRQIDFSSNDFEEILCTLSAIKTKVRKKEKFNIVS